jgi:hypothetical protein
VIAARHHRQFAVTGVLVILIVMSVRVIVSGRDDLATARSCVKAGLEETAIDYFSRSARWYMPFFTTSSDAIEGLVLISEGATQRQDNKTALRALREARRAILSSRWILTPHKDQLTAINGQIASLMAVDSPPEKFSADVSKFLAQLEKTSSPNPFLSLLATLLFVAWLVVTIGGSTRVITAEGRFVGGRSWLWIAGSLVLLASWLIMLSLV